MLTDSQIKYESFLEDVSNILNAGEIPNLFKTDEKFEIIEKVKVIVKSKSRTADCSPEALWSHFVKICKEKLHIVVCLSPIGDSFRYLNTTNMIF